MDALVALCQLAFPHTGFDEDIEIAGKVGVAGLSVFEPKFTSGEVPSRVAAVRDAGLRVGLGIPELWTVLPAPGKMLEGQPVDPAERVERIARAVTELAAFAPEAIMLCTGPAGDLGEENARRVVVEAVRELGRLAAEHGTKLAIEPMRASFRGDRTLVCSLAEVLDLLDDVGRDDVGIVADTWHLWDSPDFLADLPHAVERIDAVQIADYRVPTRGRMDRVVAGAGAADIPAILRRLQEVGFDGWYDLEIFSDDGRFGEDYPDSLWKLPPSDFAAMQVAAFQACWQEGTSG